jgi:hypothetical protein
VINRGADDNHRLLYVDFSLCFNNVTDQLRGVHMVPFDRFALTAEERYWQDIHDQLANFERRERELMAQERQERADKLGLASIGKALSDSHTT